MVRSGARADSGLRVLAGLTAQQSHRLWSDDLGFDAVHLDRVVGHRQVTDAYLVGLARHHGGEIATLDRGLAANHPDAAVLVEAPTTGHAGRG